MIQRAIEELDEEGEGVREGAISKFIKRKYEDLPWAHEGLLRHHLKKQCEIGVLVLDGGRYIFNLVMDGDVDVETESMRKRRPAQGRRGRGRWRGREEGEQILEEFEEEEIGGERQNEEMGQSEKPNMDEVEKALLAYIKLHNQGEANKDEMIKEHVQAVVDEDEVGKDNYQRMERRQNVSMTSKNRNHNKKAK